MNVIVILTGISTNALYLVNIFSVHFPSSTEWERFWQFSSYFFLLVFAVEAVLKLTGLGFKTYFQNPWNIFDFVIVLLTIAGAIAELAVDVPGSPSFLRVLRSLRLLRILRFIPKLRVFVDTLVFTLPSVFNVLMLFFVVVLARSLYLLFIYIRLCCCSC